VDKAFLEECLAEGMSLEAIGESVGKHESTVSYWLKKHGLEAAKAEKHAAKGGVAKEDLERFLAAGLSLREIARHMDCSLATIHHWICKYGLETERSARLRESISKADLGGGGGRGMHSLRIFAMRPGTRVPSPRPRGQEIPNHQPHSVADQTASGGEQVRAPLFELPRGGGGRICRGAVKFCSER